MPNIDFIVFPSTVNEAVHAHLRECESFEALMDRVAEHIEAECALVRERAYAKFMKNYGQGEVRYLSLFTDGCIESGKDVLGGGARYNNFGCHGTGIANAADALAAIKRCLYDEKKLDKEELLHALDTDFEGTEDIRRMLADSPKMGNNDDFVDEIAARLMDMFADSMSGKPNGIGGVWRAGTGSAFGYAKGLKCPATADGRHAGGPSLPIGRPMQFSTIGRCLNCTRGTTM